VTPVGRIPSVAEALVAARLAGLDRLDAQWLLAHVLGRDRSWLTAHDDQLLDAAQHSRWQHLLEQASDGTPLAYLTGEQGFRGLVLKVGPAVLIPRPDTETLVDWALECLLELGRPSPRVLDLGTGSGAVALAIGAARPDARLTAVDASEAALAVARENGERLGMSVDWRLGDWWSPVAGERFDLVVSNPPYIREGDPHLQDLRHEPAVALRSGADGLSSLRNIVEGAPPHLDAGGCLLLEHGHDQAAAVAGLLDARGFVQVKTRPDLAGRARCTGGHRPASAGGPCTQSLHKA
jgi:release factor glutamine methyltransferase